MTESQIVEIGFKLVDQYDHDQYHTYRYQQGVLQMEFTYEGKELKDISLSVSEVDSMRVNILELKALSQIFRKYKG